jgi:hypothetical protein
MICLKIHHQKEPIRILDANINNIILYGRYDLLIDKSQIYTDLYLKIRPINGLRILIMNKVNDYWTYDEIKSKNPLQSEKSVL